MCLSSAEHSGCTAMATTAIAIQRSTVKWVVNYSKLTRTRFDLINPDGTVIQANAPIDQVVAKVKAVTGG
jgi:hypothetical protein